MNDNYKSNKTIFHTPIIVKENVTFSHSARTGNQEKNTFITFFFFFNTTNILKKLI